MYVDYDEIVREWAYRVPNGKPDLNNPYHKAKLREVLVELDYPLDLLDSPKETLNEATFTPFELAKSNGKYWRPLIDKIENGEPILIENPSGEIKISKSWLKEFEKVEKTEKGFSDYFKGGGSRFIPIIPATNGQKYTLKQISKSTFTGKTSSGGKAIPKDAAYYEMAICKWHNINNVGMKEDTAISAAEIEADKYSNFSEHLDEVGQKIAKNLGSVSGKLIYTGKRSYSPSPNWTTSEGTPKTDILNSKYRISLKKRGGSQLASGGAGDAKGLFTAGLEFYKKQDSGNSKLADSIIATVDSKFKTFTADPTVTEIKQAFAEWYIDVRFPEIKNKIPKGKKYKDADIQKHAKAEAMASNMISGRGNFTTWFIDGVPDETDKITKRFKTYLKTIGNEDLKKAVQGVLEQNIIHKDLEAQFKNALENDDFKKWVVYEAATGNYKFSGDNDVNSSHEGIANSLLEFDLGGSTTFHTDMIKYAKSHASKVKTNVGFKSTGRSKFTAFRLLNENNELVEEYDLNKDIDMIMNEELDTLYKDIDDLLEEGLIDWAKKGVKKLQKAGKQLFEKIKSYVNNFFKNTIQRVLNKLKEYAKKGVQFLLDVLGIQVNGSSELTIKF
tara:strand:- start:4269 stop:6113 length:1845 start_codon:yes stop_codon:yes gene_type:complete